MLERFIHPLLHFAFLATRPLTLGVRGICYDSSSNSILLVKHTYSKGWALPGGGVEVGETVESALKRELKEEVGFAVQDATLLEIYQNREISRRDHVIIYSINNWAEIEGHSRPKIEIAKTEWFPISKLPSKLTPCSRYALAKHGDTLRDNYYFST